MTTKKEETKNLYQRLLAIMAEAGTIKKMGFNEFDKYSYVKESDISEKLQSLYVRHGVFCLNSIKSANTIQVTSSTGKPQNYSTVVAEYTFINVDNPEDRITVEAVGEGADRGDKAIYKALTGAHKYFLIRNFNLGSEEDAEKESPEVSKPVQPQVRGVREASANGLNF